MRWLDARTVLLEPNAEIAADYATCQGSAPLPPRFGLARPYGAASRGLEAADGSDGGDHEAPEGGEEAVADAGGEPRRRKKRRRRESDDAAALRAQRGDEAERCACACVVALLSSAHAHHAHSRHVAALPALENALALYAAHLAAAEPVDIAPQAPPLPALLDAEQEAASPGASTLAALVAAAEDGMPLHLELHTDAGAASAPLTGRVHANSGDSCGVASLGDVRFVLPPRCRFALGSAANLRGITGQLKGGGGGFRLLVLDPPWECASVARSGAYSTLSCGQVQALPVRQLCHVTGALVALWVTNRERIRRFVETSLLPAWGLELVAEWHWLKVTADGHAALPLSGEGAGCRRPYELLLLARSISGADASATTMTPPSGVVLLAQPGPHSRKPRLLQLLRPYAVPSPDAALPETEQCGSPAPPPRPSALDCCELFARELCADATSWGNEPLRFQQAGPT